MSYDARKENGIYQNNILPLRIYTVIVTVCSNAV